MTQVWSCSSVGDGGETLSLRTPPTCTALPLTPPASLPPDPHAVSTCETASPSVWRPHLQIDRVVEAVEETLKGHTVQLLAKKKLPRLDLPKVRWLGGRGGCGLGPCRALHQHLSRQDNHRVGEARCCMHPARRQAGKLMPARSPLACWPLPTPQVRRNRHIEILPLSTGCLGACTYCKTKHARGQLGSYDLQALVARAAAAATDPQAGTGAGAGDGGAGGQGMLWTAALPAPAAAVHCPLPSAGLRGLP